MQPETELASGVIQLDDEGILRIRIKEGAEIDLKETELSFEVYRKLGCNKNNKVLKLVDGRPFFTMDDDAQKLSAKRSKDFFIASALVNNSLSVRLLYNFFNVFHKQPVPFKMFPDEEKALKWLRSFKKK
ncbi:MAG: hypothetical protein ACHQHP_03955 [Bacteroidia bacterium]